MPEHRAQNPGVSNQQDPFPVEAFGHLVEAVRDALVEVAAAFAAGHKNIVFEPEWTPDMMTEEAKLELGML